MVIIWRVTLVDIQTIKALFDAFYQAKRIRELLPALPDGVTPTYIHILDIIETLQRQGAEVRAVSYTHLDVYKRQVTDKSEPYVS